MLKYLLTIGIKIIITLITNQNAIAEITVKVVETTIIQNQPIHLTIEADATFGGIPDFSNLESDFVIAQHYSNYNTRRFNGQTQQRITLNLILYPKHSGNLTIPPLRIGNEESQPIPIQVTSLPNPDTNSQKQEELFPIHTNRNKNFNIQSYAEPITNVNIANSNSNSISNNSNVWVWLTTITTFGWIITILAWWYQWRKVKYRNFFITTTEPVNSPILLRHPPVEILIANVKKAYKDIDPFAARNALLHWAKQMWPDDPPTNLSRLAARCDPPLQWEILVLEQSLYSPEPMSWHKQPVWEFIENKLITMELK